MSGEQARAEPTGHAHPIRAWAATLLLPVLALVAVGVLIDRPRPAGEPARRERRAALAIRDAVDPAEVLLTWAFVAPRLERAYGEVRTVTERQPFDGPSRERFVADFLDLAARYAEIDIYCLAHTNDYVTWLARTPRDLTGRIRLVYNSGCDCGAQAPDWLALGADSVVAHPGVAAHAPFFFYFARRWWAGAPLADAVAAAQSQAEGFFARLAALGADPADDLGLVRRSPGTLTGDATLTFEGAR